MKLGGKWGADPLGPVGNCKASEDRGRGRRVPSRGKCSSHLELTGCLWLLVMHVPSQAGEAALRWRLACRTYLTPQDQLL